MRVPMLVDHAFGVSGPHRNVVGSLNALGARDDLEVVLLTGMIDPSEPYASAPNITICQGFRPHDPKQLAANLWRIRRAARGCDVIYVPSRLKALQYAQAAHPGRRLVAGPNVTPLPIGKRHDSPGPIELRYLSDLWFEASMARRDHVRRVSGVDSIASIQHSIDTDRFSPQHRNVAVWEGVNVPTDGIRALYVGKDYALKGVSQLLDAADRLNTSGRHDVHIVLVGNMSGETLERTASMANVFPVGFQMGSKLATILASADMSVVPSSWENFPFTVMEAMASGTPVIGSRVGGIPEMIVDGETGVLVDIADGQAYRPDAGAILADAIALLADDRDLRGRLGAGARQRVLDRFTEQRLGDDLMRVFRGESPPEVTPTEREVPVL